MTKTEDEKAAAAEAAATANTNTTTTAAAKSQRQGEARGKLATLLPARVSHISCSAVPKEGVGDGGAGGGCTQIMHSRATPQCRDGARRVSTNKGGIACTKREAPGGG